MSQDTSPDDELELIPLRCCLLIINVLVVDWLDILAGEIGIISQLRFFIFVNKVLDSVGISYLELSLRFFYSFNVTLVHILSFHAFDRHDGHEKVGWL